MKTLDQDVTVIDPSVAEAAFSREFKGVHLPANARRRRPV